MFERANKNVFVIRVGAGVSGAGFPLLDAAYSPYAHPGLYSNAALQYRYNLEIFGTSDNTIIMASANLQTACERNFRVSLLFCVMKIYCHVFRLQPP